MRFKNGQLIVGTEFPNIVDMRVIQESGIVRHEYNDEIYLIRKEVIKDRFLWLYCEFDNSYLYGERVYDRTEDVYFDNTRDRNHIELRKQLFALYDVRSGMLYINDYNKRGFLKDYLGKVLDRGVITIKNIYSSVEEFQASVKFLKKVKFVRERDLMSMLDPDVIFEKKGNIFGLDLPDKYMLQLEYNTPIEKAKNAIRQLSEKRNKGYFKEIILVGENDEGIEENFNFSTLIQNIEVAVRKNENERYDEEEVKQLLIKIIEEKHVQRA